MFTRPPPWPVAPARMLSLFEIEHDAQESPYRAKIRALSGQRSTTLEMVISGVICANGVLQADGGRRTRPPRIWIVPLRIVLATSSARSGQRRRLLIALGLAGIAFVVEAIAAVVANSLALLAESFHVLIDVVAGRQAADTLAAFLIVVLIVPRAVSLLREALNVLLEATPAGVELDVLREHVLGCSGVKDIHDLHVWTITSGVNVISAHVVVHRGADPSAVLDDLETCLRGDFDIEHSTFQLENEDRQRLERAGHP